MTAQFDVVPARWRAPYLCRMLALEVGQSDDLYPEAGDTLGALWSRVQKQAARYRSVGRHFHLHKRTDHIFVQRVEQDQRAKLTPFLRLAVGEKMLCTDPFETDKERKNLRRRLLYLWERGPFIWLEQHADGSLYYRCATHLDAREPLWSEHPVDDGSDFRGARVVCCPSELRAFQAEFERIKAAILANRADASGVACE